MKIVCSYCKRIWVKKIRMMTIESPTVCARIVGFLSGEVMECVYARLPEGCGQTNHCFACTVRNTVMAAIESGEPQVHVPVELQRDGGKLRMIVSTEKVGSFVRMIID